MTVLNRREVAEALAAAMEFGLARARTAFEELQTSLEGESKSTAGDKHETGRAMVQMEMEQAAARLSRVEGMMRQWHALEPLRGREQVRPGAIVSTDQGGFILGVAWGKFEGPGDATWRAISSDAPLAQAMQSLGPGDTVEFRGRMWHIISVG
jgi:transcription elongation GreA/GreB family factor